MSPSCALQDKLYQEEYQLVAAEEEREEISRKLSEASSWMEDEGYTAPTKVRRHQCEAEKDTGNMWQFPTSPVPSNGS